MSKQSSAPFELNDSKFFGKSAIKPLIMTDKKMVATISTRFEKRAIFQRTVKQTP